MKKRLSDYPLPIRLGLPVLILLLAASGGLAVLAAGGFTIPIARTTGGGQVMTGEGYTVVGAIGQPDAGQLSGEGLRVNGGVIGEAISGTQTPSVRPRVYMPIAWRVYPITAMNESEPNDLFSQADPIPSLPVRVFGAHDGEVGGGDVFSFELEAGRGTEIILSTGNAEGVQLLAYDAAGNEITRDYEDQFALAFNTSYTGTYYVYVFSSPEADNYASYTITIRAGGPLPGITTGEAPAMDAERLNQAPQVEPVTP
jgi:hypothetical protein